MGPHDAQAVKKVAKELRARRHVMQGRLPRLRHTPGPWTAGNGLLVRVFPVGSNSPICGIHIRGRDGTQDQRRAIAEANASLIAAAPELLTALNVLVAMTEDYLNDPRELDHVMTALDGARAAIAKAEPVI